MQYLLQKVQEASLQKKKEVSKSSITKIIKKTHPFNFQVDTMKTRRTIKIFFFKKKNDDQTF